MIIALARLVGLSPLTVEHSEMEAQHQQLHQLIADFFEKMRFNDDASSAFKRLHESMIEHFETEQQLMETSGYRSKQRHIETHNTLLQHLEGIFQDYPIGKASTDYVDEQEKAFNKALNKHIAISDFLLASFLQKTN
jgi:hemerythrin-like metal-binding protein